MVPEYSSEKPPLNPKRREINTPVTKEGRKKREKEYKQSSDPIYPAILSARD